MSDVEKLVAAWLPQQRWFGGKGREHTLRLTALAPLPGGAVMIWLARVVYAEGDSELYCVPLVNHREPVAHLEHALVGTISQQWLDDDTGDLERSDDQWIYDALHDKDVTDAWLVGIRDQLDVPPLTFRLLADPAEIPVEAPSLAMRGEQSNTSLVYSDQNINGAVLKVFRRLQPGVNPDIELLQGLSRLGAAHIARLLGTVSAEIAGERCELAVLSEYLTTATDGWELAKASVRDLLAEADLHADEAGGDFAAEAERLGAAVAAVHEDLATVFGTFPAGHDAVVQRADAMHARLDEAIAIVPDLGEMASGLHGVFERFAEASTGLTLQRVHGDLHLGQVLRTVRRWVLIDFEGEPAAALEDRRRPDSALRDVAGMLRSFEYAAHQPLLEIGNNGAQPAYRADEWSERNRHAFLDGYAAECGDDPREHVETLIAFEVDKAVYEAVYEARHRPAWLPIPLRSLNRLAGANP